MNLKPICLQFSWITELNGKPFTSIVLVEYRMKCVNKQTGPRGRGVSVGRPARGSG